MAMAALALFETSAALAAPRPRDAAQALVAEVSREAPGGGVREALAEARRALTRADRARLAGDHRHAAELEELSLEWAEAARDRARLARAERHAAALEKKVTDNETKLEAARTLIEQTGAQRARAEAELAELERAAAAPPPPPASATRPKPSSKPKATPQ